VRIVLGLEGNFFINRQVGAAEIVLSATFTRIKIL
jgi:hypothetical protein